MLGLIHSLDLCNSQQIILHTDDIDRLFRVRDRGGLLVLQIISVNKTNNRCDDEQEFETKYRALPAGEKIKIFPILFGEGDPKEIKDLADLTGGRVFDATKDPLDVVFKEIRGYQ